MVMVWCKTQAKLWGSGACARNPTADIGEFLGFQGGEETSIERLIYSEGVLFDRIRFDFVRMMMMMMIMMMMMMS